MKNYKIKTSFVGPEGPDRTITKMVLILIFVEDFLLYDNIHDFSEWLRAGSYPVDINPFRSHTGKATEINESCY